MSEEKLKPCPFCGGRAIIAQISESDDYYVVCESCCSTIDYYDKEKAVRIWNSRSLEDEKDREIERLNKILKQVDNIVTGEPALGLYKYEYEFRQIANIINLFYKDTNDTNNNDGSIEKE